MSILHTARLGLVCVLLLGVASGLQAKLITQEVQYRDAQDNTPLKGYFAYDDQFTANGKLLPGVLVAPEWWGMDDYVRQRAQQLAALGYAAFVIDLYGNGQGTTSSQQAAAWSHPFYADTGLMVSRAQAASQALLQTKVADQNRIAAIGYCFGGAVCQALAYSGTPLRGVVCFHTSLLPTSTEGLVRAKASGVKFLICQGADDPFAKPVEVMKLKIAWEQDGISCQVIEYPGAMHAFSNPQADALARANGLQGVAYNANADKQSWEAMKKFLDQIFAKTGKN